MKSFLFAIAILCAIPSQILASTCPPPPMPLRQLVSNSENILIGRVLSVQQNTINDIGGLQAEFEVHQVLQGKIKTKTIFLFMDPWTQQRMNDKITDGGRMLVFLNLPKNTQGLYFPSAYQSSYKILDEAGLNAYRQRIKEVQAIQALKDEKRRDQLTINWLISCTENPYTHWEGAYELALHSSFLGYYDEEKGDFVARIVLSESQKLRIRTMFLGLTEIQGTDLFLIDTIAGWEDIEIRYLLVNYLKSVDSKLLYQHQNLMYRIETMTQREDLRETLEKLRNLKFRDDLSWEEQLNVIGIEFVKLL